MRTVSGIVGIFLTIGIVLGLVLFPWEVMNRADLLFVMNSVFALLFLASVGFFGWNIGASAWESFVKRRNF